MKEQIKKIKHLLHLHACKQKGLSSDQPTPYEWSMTVQDANEAIESLESYSPSLQPISEERSTSVFAPENKHGICFGVFYDKENAKAHLENLKDDLVMKLGGMHIKEFKVFDADGKKWLLSRGVAKESEGNLKSNIITKLREEIKTYDRLISKAPEEGKDAMTQTQNGLLRAITCIQSL